MVSLFESVNGEDPELVITSSVKNTVDLAGKVVLVLGDSPLALAALERARSDGAKVVHASLSASAPASSKRLSSADYDSFVQAFQQTKAENGHLDIVVAGFALADLSADGKTAKSSKQAVDDTLKPMINSAKLALYHFRRDLREHKKHQRFVALIETVDLNGGSDPLASGIAMAVLGMFRSAQHHWDAAGAWFDLVAIPAEASRKETELGVSCVFARSTTTLDVQSSIHLISNDHTKTLAPAYGQIRRPPAYGGLDNRLKRVVYLKGSILNFKIRHGSSIRKLAIVLPLCLAAAWWTETFTFASSWALIAGFVFTKAVLA